MDEVLANYQGVNRMSDTKEMYMAEAEERAELREDLMRKVLIEELKNPIVLVYSGYGDSSNIEEAPNEKAADYLWKHMWSIHAGFENNDGGDGTVTWDLTTDEIRIEHRQAFVDYECSEHTV